MSDNDKILVKYILEESEFLYLNSIRISYESFIKSAVLKRAFSRSIEIIGEASKKLSIEFKEKYNSINWRAISGMRDKLIHEYFGVDYQIVWDVANNKSKELIDFY
jgi:uncharacterized protein with HEPN domain